MQQENSLESDQILDLDILTQYTQAIGNDVLLISVNVFEQQYPQYVAELLAFQSAADHKEVAAQGHKMKGAAGAIGLHRLANWAQIIQHSEAESWNTTYPQAIELIEQYYQSDIDALKRFLQA
ncbi:Hpt domain-containing protein [Psychrobium sp. 1_MG-2023]|uniref:Hpt domain-containing protein n=1 Tax=Psychrobium sp. 1_MG-2023 TaxID=3062624 RepID=UPI000C31C5C1|nr:Hpt domain-containing protein [Psychrobium sp. 1_MG-2023]MDP2560960.1 Hpt domain-containing protein [Psychrobium sp. 1_MG-2023]PKF56032.1 histidine kinase [Alteromonadales bacterium alter-6D02]